MEIDLNNAYEEIARLRGMIATFIEAANRIREIEGIYNPYENEQAVVFLDGWYAGYIRAVRILDETLNPIGMYYGGDE